MSLYWFITFIVLMKMTSKPHVNVLATFFHTIFICVKCYGCNPSCTKWNNSDLNQK